ncbi:MAG: amino acid permease [Xanthomonadales bacterium]|nr:amino acid permease [Xanthomonadales bacterium]NNL94672.1 amino acid permease [Xanthomonadales bacterium]
MTISSSEEALKRAIGKLGFSAVNLNSVIGAGIFGLPAVVAARAGYFSPWAFLIGGLLIFTIVLSFARASSMFRTTGGAIEYASHAFGPFVGFQTGWLSYLARVSAMGANTNLLVTYASWFWAPLDGDPYRAIALTVLISSMTWLNVIGVKNSVGITYIFTILKLLPLSLLILFGLGHVEPAQLFRAELPDMGGFGETILVLLYAYVGFEGTVVTAGEGRSPRRDMPAALVQPIIAIAAIYFLVQTVSVFVLPDLASSDAALADVASALFGNIGATILILGAVFSIAGNLSASLLSAPRMSYALARDGTMPRWFSAVHPRYRTPHHSIWFYGFLCLAMALSGSFIWLAVMSTLVRLLTYMVCIAALPRLERTTESYDGQFKLPGGMLIPAVAFGLSLWLMTRASLDAWYTMLAFFAVGTALYAYSTRRSG